MPVQLISPLWGPLSSQQAAQGLSDSNSDFLVVGVCSSEARLGPSLVAALTGQTAHAVQGALAGNAQQLPGLQMHVSPLDRIITLDASAMLSPMLLTSILFSNRPQPAVSSTAAAAVRAAARKAGNSNSSSSSVPVEGVALLLALQLLVFLCAVCNVVVVSADCIDLQLLQLLEAAGLIAASLPDIASQQQQQQQQQQPEPAAGAALPTKGRQGRRRTSQQQQQQQQQLKGSATAAAPGGSHIADLVLLQCGKPHRASGLQQHHQQQQMVDTCLASTVWHSRRQQLLQRSSSVAAGSNETGPAIWTASPMPPPPPPATAGSDAAAAASAVRLPVELQQLVNKLLHYPRTASSSSSSSSARGGAFSRAVTEGEWLKGAERVWDAVQDSSELLQYYRAAAEVRLVGAGGWSSSARLAQQAVGDDAW